MRRLSMFGGFVILALAVLIGSGGSPGTTEGGENTNEAEQDVQKKKKGAKKKGLQSVLDKLDLNAAQKSTIADLQKEYKPKVADLQKRVKELESQERQDISKVLTDDQKKTFAELTKKGKKKKSKSAGE